MKNDRNRTRTIGLFAFLNVISTTRADPRNTMAPSYDSESISRGRIPASVTEIRATRRKDKTWTRQEWRAEI